MSHRIRRILVGIKDPTARRLPAVAKATQLAAALGAELELYHAIDTPLYLDQIRLEGKTLASVERRLVERFTTQMENIARAVRRHRVAAQVVVEWDYPVYEALLRRAARIGADLIIAERHARRHIAPWLLHFTDWELLRLAPVPVLLVKDPRPWRRPAILAAIDPLHAYAKPGTLDRDILRLGVTLEGALHGRLHAMHAYVPLSSDMMAGFDSALIAASAVGAQLQADAVERSRAAFDRAVKSFGVPHSRQHLLSGHPMDAIPAAARDTRAGLVIMGAVSRSGLKRLLIGNTAERVLDRLACDLLIIKPHRFASHVRRTARGVRLAMNLPPR